MTPATPSLSRLETEEKARVALVTGATGAIGRTLVAHLRNVGWRVRVLSRLERPSLPSDEWVTGDFCSREIARRATRGADAVFHLAARLHVSNPAPRVASEYRRVNVDGARTLAEAAAAAGAGRFIHFSTIAVYGKYRGTPFTEDQEPCPTGLYAESKCDSERAVLELASRSPMVVVVLRLAAVYGPNLKGNYLRLVSSLCRGTFLPVGRGENRRTLVHEDDVARAALLAAEHATSGDIFNVTDGEAHPVREIVESISAALGRKPPRFHAPALVVRAALHGAEWPFRLAGRPAPVGVWLLDKYLEEIVASGSRFKETIGFVPKVDLWQGWKQTVAGLRASGAIPARCRGARPS